MTIPLTALANPVPASTTLATSTTTNSPASVPNPTTATFFPTATPSSTEGISDSGLSSSAKGGIIGGVVGGVVIFSALGFFSFRRRPMKTKAPKGRVYIPPDTEEGNDKAGGN